MARGEPQKRLQLLRLAGCWPWLTSTRSCAVLQSAAGCQCHDMRIRSQHTQRSTLHQSVSQQLPDTSSCIVLETAALVLLGGNGC
jgi:hypothetical protein